MLVEDLNLSNVVEQIVNDRKWIEEVAFCRGKMFTEESKHEAGRLRVWLIEHHKMLMDLQEYVTLREKLLNLVHETGKKDLDPAQISMFDN